MYFFSSTALCILLMACGSTKSLQTRQKIVPISVQTIPSGAKIYVDGKLISTTSPAIINVPSSANAFRGTKQEQARIIESNTINIQVVKEGYEAVKDFIVPKTNRVGLGTGGWGLYWPENLIYELKESADAYEKDPTIPVGVAQERVTRNTSGNTALERNIIRWFFDSAPQGARIFWRVISSIPTEVKNTNELYLGTTPYEETRSFNIQGLTYINSRDIQIEIKVRRKGYIEQSKRFNVRQAIDQQEISSFFDLVKE